MEERSKSWLRDTSVHRKHLDLMELLISLPEFAKQVCSIRQMFCIPDNGFPGGEIGIELHETWLLDLTGDSARFDVWLYETRQLWQKAKALRSDERFLNCIRTYILFEIVTAPVANYEIQRHYTNGRPGALNVTAYDVLTKKERTQAHEVLEYVREVRGEPTQKHYAPKKHLERDKEILKRASRRGKQVETFDETYRYSTKDIAAEVFEETDIEGDRKNAQLARKIIERRTKEVQERLGWDIKGN